MRLQSWLVGVGASALGLASSGAASADDQPTTPPPAPPPAAAATAAPAAATPAPMANPSMTAPLAANPNPFQVDLGPLGRIDFDGVVTGLAFWQSSPQVDAFGGVTRSNYLDVSNAQIIINKQDGPIQFYVQAGLYSIPSLGAPYYRSTTASHDLFGFVPQGFVKIVPNAVFSFEVGALPTLIGEEYTFTFENMNIERGLLWGQEPAVSKGVQGNVTKGPWAFSVAFTDGYDLNAYDVLSGLATYTFKNADTLTLDGEGALSTYRPATLLDALRAPPEQANGQIYNLAYSHTKGPFTISPYIQYGSAPNIAGVSASGEAWGGAVLAKYSFTPHIALAGRVEYITSSGAGNLLGYGVGSNAWSVTLTPTYQLGVFFVRGEVSYVGVGSGSPGLVFGPTGRATDQTRALLETGVIF